MAIPFLLKEIKLRILLINQPRSKEKNIFILRQIKRLTFAHRNNPNMKIIFILNLLLGITILGRSQSTLDSTNGFKNIKLGTLIDAYKNILHSPSLKKKIGSKIYIVNDKAYLKVGTIKLSSVSIGVTNDTIRNILLTVNVKKGDELLSALLNKYGYPTYMNSKGDTYRWETHKILLKFYRSQNQYIYFIQDNYFLKEQEFKTRLNNLEDL